MISRLILSLRKAVDEGIILFWNEGHFSVDQLNGTTSQEMTTLRFGSSRTLRVMKPGDTTA